MKILLVEDHAVMRMGLKQLLTETMAGVTFEDAGTAEEALERVGSAAFDLVILDISLPNGSGLDVLKKLKHMRPRLPVLILSVYAEEEFAVRTLRAGASGYVTKKTAPTELVAAVRKAIGGGRYVTASLAEKLAGEVGQASELEPHERLSDREYEVFRLLGSGKTVKQAAQELTLSVQTVSTYRARILQKMGLPDNSALVEYVFRNGLFV